MATAHTFLSFPELLNEIFDALPKFVFGLFVQDRIGLRQIVGNMTIARSDYGSSHLMGQLEEFSRWKLPPRVGQEPVDVSQTLQVPNVHFCALVAKGPVFPVLSKDVFFACGGLVLI